MYVRKYVLPYALAQPASQQLSRAVAGSKVNGLFPVFSRLFIIIMSIPQLASLQWRAILLHNVSCVHRVHPYMYTCRTYIHDHSACKGRVVSSSRNNIPIDGYNMLI